MRRTGLGATSGVGIANLALGLADSYTEIGPRALTIWRGAMFEDFAQDSWKVSSKLHVDYGIRVTTIQGFHALWGNSDYFDGALYNPAQAVQVDRKTGNVILGTGNPYNGVVIPGFSSFPNSAVGRVLAATPATANQCDGASCSGLFAPNLSPDYIDTSNAVAAAPRYRVPDRRQDRGARRRRPLHHPHGPARQHLPGRQLSVPAVRDGEQCFGGQSRARR